jgi:ribosome biogenesis GTPase
MSALDAYGWNEDLAAHARDAQRPQARPGRVIRVDFSLVTVITEAGIIRASPPDVSIATGDWVLVEAIGDGEAVVAVLPRHSSFERGDPMDGVARNAQVIAANLDTVFIVHSLTNGPNLRRLERELILVYESGAQPVIVCNKVDLADDFDEADVLDDVATVAPGIDVVFTSATTGQGIDELRAYAQAPRTVALIGPSGVGKSTLVNRLVGSEVQETGDVRTSDQRGRHTTTARELVLLPEGGVLLDTPGLRAVSLWDADEGFARAFADIEELATHCKFNDCAHGSEPGCAVLAAVERGELTAERLDSYQRLDDELDTAARRRDERLGSKTIKSYKKLHPEKM